MGQPIHNIVPHLKTALTGPLQELERHLLKHQSSIEAWFIQQWKTSPAPFYASVDLRNSGFKVAPVDTNLYPAGFNNLNPDALPLCIQAAQTGLAKFDASRNILIIPENHTRNKAYFSSLSALKNILDKSGCKTKIGSLIPELSEPMHVPIDEQNDLTLHPIQRTQDQLHINEFVPDIILLNNDLTDGIPELLSNIRQKIVPSHELGWWNRSKSNHFEHYANVAHEFAEHVDLDSWLITPLHRQCGEINFMKRTGGECLEKNVGMLLSSIQEKYDAYGLEHKPYVVIKADAGTYGMGVMIAHSIDDVKQLNRKQRTKMAASKGGQTVEKVILQEGVYSFETVNNKKDVAEPVVYMLDNFVVGGFYRIHADRGPAENLNAPGMHFEPLAFAETCITPKPELDPDAAPNRFYTYGVIARLALLAASRELIEVDA